MVDADEQELRIEKGQRCPVNYLPFSAPDGGGFPDGGGGDDINPTHSVQQKEPSNQRGNRPELYRPPQLISFT